MTSILISICDPVISLIYEGGHAKVQVLNYCLSKTGVIDLSSEADKCHFRFIR